MVALDGTDGGITDAFPIFEIDVGSMPISFDVEVSSASAYGLSSPLIYQLNMDLCSKQYVSGGVQS